MTPFSLLLVVALQVQPTPTPATASADVMQCAQARLVVEQLLDAAMRRTETARQTNTPADLRAAIDDVETIMRDVRAQLAPCATLQPAPNAHAGHGPTTTGADAPAEPPATKDLPPTAKPASKPSAADPHAGHTMAPAKSAPPPTTSAPTPKPAAKPSATDPHAGHTMAPAKPAPPPAKGAPAPAKPTPAAKPPGGTPHADHDAAPARSTTTVTEQQAVDPVCGLHVDAQTAPSARHDGRTYHFCSDQHRQLFQKNPAKYLPAKR